MLVLALYWEERRSEGLNICIWKVGIEKLRTLFKNRMLRFPFSSFFALDIVRLGKQRR